MVADFEDYFTSGCGRCPRHATPDCSTRQWHQGLTELRVICLELGLRETLKWAHPCYMHAGRNIAIIGALRADFRLSFFNAALLRDPESILEKAGPNTRDAGIMRFDDPRQVRERDWVIRAYLTEAMGYAEKGILPARAPRDVELPDELVEALDADPDLAEAFGDLTPGRQRSYVINLNGAKKSETRTARITKFRDRILAGKGATER